MLIRGKDIEDILKEKISGITEVEAIDFKGGNHWQLRIVAESFNGLSRVKREQLIQKALADLLRDETIHALTIQAKGTAEA